MKNENYITILGWMRNELHLKGNELLIYAIIYGFSQNENQKFTGSANYLAEWCGITRRAVMSCLKNLINKNIILKEDIHKNGVKFVNYSINPDVI